jgi:glyoxylase-like metal-dependent hydrolase (beta-lactamase superfamily II)
MISAVSGRLEQGLAFPSSATIRAPEALVLKGGRWRTISIPVRYGAFTHAIGGRCLIDTGYTRRVSAGKRSLALRLYTALLGPKLSDAILPDAHPKVDTILITHLHADHVSALRDYPYARVVLDKGALAHFLNASAFARLRHGVFAELLPEGLLSRAHGIEDMPVVEAPLGLGPGRDVFGDGSVLGVPLPGHMRGHWGFVFTGGERPLLYAADAQWLARAALENRPPGWPASLIFHDHRAARETEARLRAFAGAGGRLVFCHDPEPVAALATGGGA